MNKLTFAKGFDKTLAIHFIVRMPSREADDLLSEFASLEVRDRLKEKRESGKHGWHTAQCTNADLVNALKAKLDKGDYVDVMTYAAMLLARQRLFKEE